MLSFVALATRPEFSVSAVTCRNDHTRWSEAETYDGFRVVLVRRGRFRWKTGGLTADIDPTLAYLGVPGQEERFAHPAGGDVCTAFSLAPSLWRALAGDTRRANTSTVYVDARLDLAHRRFLAAARTGDTDFAATERLLDLIGRVVTRAVTGPTPAGTPVTGRDRALVAEARRVIDEGHPAARGLLPLAELLGVSPYRLSRAFTRELGVSLTCYRNRVRVATALDRLEAGETHLGALAADLGFADQPHLCRTIRTHLGTTPAALRRLLT
ncbi:helix-turn-helix transcriptional regulator [Streptomyces sp. 6N223]|uniref:helix-turn-helix transcriptional regulator n=1 Tax=Streptomyces sp. 6N223 TaxID=3457412 RepID=UPI003FCF7DD4